MSKPTHFAQLDGLRALAVLMVIACHTLPYCHALGGAGVRLFFVLSGFLITGILLNLRDANLGASLWSFYARRSLRIFPLYFLALAACAVWGLPELARCWPWLVTYTSNIRVAVLGYWDQGAVSHFWSLAVEEQFYLVWPFIILLASRRSLPWIIGCCVLLGVATRMVFGHTEESAAIWQMPACMDSLALGGWLAWRRWDNRSELSGKRLFVLGVCLITVSYQLGESVLAMALISRAIENRSGFWDRMLQLKPLVNLGAISYGLYVWHGIVYHLVLDKPSIPGFLLVTAISLGLSLLSWYLVEKPLNQLRHRFPYPDLGYNHVICSSKSSYGQSRLSCVC